MNNKKAVTEIELKNNKVLTISTRKLEAGLIISTASVATREGVFLSHLVHQDFYLYIAKETCTRITQKAIDAVHSKSLDRLEEIKNKVNGHYGIELC